MHRVLARYSTAFSVGLIALSSAGLRTFYAHAVLAQFSTLPPTAQNSYDLGYLVPDSPSYIEPAAALLTGDLTGAVSLIRPIGYPAFLALFGLKFGAVLYAQALVASLVAVLSFFLVKQLTARRLYGFGAGMIAALSPTGVALPSAISSDSLFAALFAAMFVTLIVGARQNSFSYITCSALLAGIGILVRPIGIFLPLVAVVVFWLVRCTRIERGSSAGFRWVLDRHHLAHALVLFFVPLIFMGSWATANYARFHVFTVSTIGDLTLREYLAVRAEEWGKAGHAPSYDAIRQNQKDVRERLRALPLQDQLRSYWPQSIAIFKKYPAASGMAFLQNVVGNAVGGWNRFSAQLPLSSPTLRGAFSAIELLDSLLRWIGLLVMTIAPFIALATVIGKSSRDESELAWTILAISFCFAGYITLLGVTFWTGPRVIYPVEILQTTTGALLLVIFKRVVQRFRQRHRMGERVARPEPLDPAFGA